MNARQPSPLTLAQRRHLRHARKLLQELFRPAAMDQINTVLEGLTWATPAEQQRLGELIAQGQIDEAVAYARSIIPRPQTH